MPQPNILIVTVDGLRASALGAYGNTSFGTPALDHFAAESFALDWCYAPGAELGEAYRALWHSQHPLRPAPAAAGVSLPRRMSDRGYRTILVTDQLELKTFAGADAFHELVQVAAAATIVGVESRAEDVAGTATARLFAAACDVVAAESDDASRLVWVHSRGMYGPWDAPLELQQSLLEEGDPPPVEAVAPPGFMLADDGDPDAVFRYSSAYAGQVMVLDACWKALMEATTHAASNDNDWLVMLLGVRGYPLGEHGRIGGVDARLYGEQLHVPLLLRFPSGLGRLARSGALTSHLDVLPTLIHWMEDRPPDLGAPLDGLSLLPLATSARSAWRDALVFGSDGGSRAIRTAAWCLRQHPAGLDENAVAILPGSKSELFVRPDDRWEANDVAKLCPEVVETLAHAIDDVSRRIAQNEPLPMNVLPSETPACGA